MPVSDLLWLLGADVEAQGITPAAPTVSLRLASPDAYLSSDDRPTGLVAKVFRGSDARRPVATLTQARSRKGQMQLSGVGSGELAINNHHADVADVRMDDVVRFEMDGRAVHQWVVAGQRSATMRPDEADEETVSSGPGILALLAECPIYPTRGVGRKPIERDRIWSWVSPAPIYDDTTWQRPYVIATVAEAKQVWGYLPFWDGLPDSLASDIDVIGPRWPTSRWTGDYETWQAPGGDWYTRQSFETDVDGNYGFYAVADDKAEVWIDGVQMLSVDGWQKPTYAEVELSAGSHMLAVHGINESLDGQQGGLGQGPTGVAYAAWLLNEGGNLTGGPVVVSDATAAKIRQYCDPPGMTFGRVWRLLMAEWQTMDYALGWTHTFTDANDSQGAPWTEREWATKVGTDGRTFLLDECAKAYVDARAHNGGLVLDAAEHSTLGDTRSLTLTGPTDRDPTTANITELSHDLEAARGTTALVLSDVGWTEASVATSGRKRGVFLSLGAQPSIGAAAELARSELSWMSDTTEAITAGFLPRSTDERPDNAAEVGDRITLPTRSGGTSVERVLSWSFGEDEHGTVTWSPELKSVRLDAIERHEQALKKMSDGTSRGRSSVTTPASQVTTSSTTSRDCCIPSIPQEGGGES